VTVPTEFPYRGGFDYENKGTPFEYWEVKDLQYLTLVGETDRDTAKPWPAAEWMDVIDARSPASLAVRSNTTTPNAAAGVTVAKDKVPKQKISIADWKKRKEGGVKSSPGPNKSHERNSSAVSGGEPLSRDNSFEGVESRQNGASTSFNSNKGAVKAVERYVYVVFGGFNMLICSSQTCSASSHPIQCKGASTRNYKRTYTYSYLRTAKRTYLPSQRIPIPTRTYQA
jgi:hypothetical protein